MQRIYIAGPYTKGDVAQNVKKAMTVANDLINLGFAPYCPHLTHFLHMNSPQPYMKWLEIDIEYLKVCDAVFLISGESKGADIEVKEAKNNNIPVFFSYEELKDFFF